MNLNPKPHGKPILCVDFDGCIHSYKSGWQGVDNLPDPPVPGVFEWLKAALEYFDIHVYSSRSSDENGIEAMYQYIKKHGGYDLAIQLYFAHEKPRAWLTIDDRCICFNGKWDDAGLNPQKLLQFVPWYKEQK
jgi:hypothetical protein